MPKTILIDRPPRIQPELPFGTVEIPAPPQSKEGGMMRLLEVGLPMIAVFGSVFMMVGAGSGQRSPIMVIPMLLSIVGSAGVGVFMFLRERREQARAEQAYAERLVELNKQMHESHDLQRRFYSYNYPDPDRVWQIVADARTEVEKERRTLRADSRLWERRTDDLDFGVVRLGMGALPSTVVYTLRDEQDVTNPQFRAALKLKETSRHVTDIPVIISLREVSEEKREELQQEQARGDGAEAAEGKEEKETPRTPFTHALGVAGDQESVYEFIRPLLAGFLAFHAPMDARLHLLAGRKAPWDWTDVVPHCADDETVRRRFFVDEHADKHPAEGPARDPDDEEPPLARYLEGIRKILSQRRLQLSEDEEETKGKGDPTLPFLLLVVDLLDSAYDSSAPLNNLESDAAISILLGDGPRLGAAVIFLVPERSKIPSGCTAVVEVQKTTPATNSRSSEFERLHFRYGEIGVNSYRYVGQADVVRAAAAMSELARRLAELDVRRSFGADIQSAVPFMQVMGYESMAQLEQDAWRRWQETTEPTRSGWLRARLGLMSGNKLRTLVFAAKRDGVHGMVAGSTGSGKSELLISLITGMAVTYDPSVLNFVLVDYKGGGAFKGFEDLPHCVDIITNLGSAGVTRMFTAINAELQRRQKLNADTGTKDIVDYRQRGLHRTVAPYPFLFVIIDEFAEMIADRAEFKAQLETITRVGRAQGVSLLLAAQRPSGVTDQMRSNIKFRICLRVETPGESRELLRRTDAAFLPGGIPGRGYLQVGNDEIELVQVAYAGDKYVEPNQTATGPVIWPDRGGVYDPRSDREPPELYRAAVARLADLARRNDRPKQSAPWPAFLPTQLSLSTVLLSADPAVPSLTAERYLDPHDLDYILHGEKREPLLSLSPSLGRWLGEGQGWIEPPDWNRFAVRPVVGLVDNPYAARQHPLVVHLPRGHAAIFGASGWGKTTFLRTLALSLAATHSPDALHLYVLDSSARGLGMLEKLPHTGAVINPDEEGYRERVEQLLRELESIVDKRKAVLFETGTPDACKYNEQHPKEAMPAIVVLLDNFTEFKEAFGTEKDDVETPLTKYIQLARAGRAYGISFVLTASSIGVLPGIMLNLFTELFTLKLADATEYRTVVGGPVEAVPDIAGRGYLKAEQTPLAFQAALPFGGGTTGTVTGSRASATDAEQVERLAQAMRTHMEAVTKRTGHTYRVPVMIGALPKSVLFKTLLSRMYGLPADETFLSRLADVTAANWAASQAGGAPSKPPPGKTLPPDPGYPVPEWADWLRVTFSLGSGDNLRTLRLSADRDGVHGLIAGGTGSGKSELLMTMICGLALNYDPSILNFLLVDYKGGGAFKPFEHLPHCVDTITNLNKAAVHRMFTAINAEMMRRQKLNADTGTKDIIDYRARGYHLTREPYPHLFIIIDEYAEMISDSPEFKAELDSITRVGRSAGVNLVLAAQRPTGVTDQMRANIKFRICLRVEGVDTSREMLRRSDAAFLPNGLPGRGYLQVGNENIELMHIAYTGEEYPYAPANKDDRKPRFFDVVVQLANELLATTGGAQPRTPWPPFLPRLLTLGDGLTHDYVDPAYLPLIEAGEPELRLNPWLSNWLAGQGAWRGVDWSWQALRGVVGLVDNPAAARQLPLVIDLNKGHVVVFGASGYGKTELLTTLVVSLAATHSPDELHVHALDLSGRNLSLLRKLPHVGTVIVPDERGYEERVQQLMRELIGLVEARKQKFFEAGAQTLPEYNAAHPTTPEPAVLLLIDGIGDFIETFGGENQEKEEFNQLNKLVALLRQCKLYGVHIVVTALRLNAVPARLLSLFAERLTLRLVDAEDYSQIVGMRVIEVDEIPGRGIARVGPDALNFQVARAALLDAEGKMLHGAPVIQALGDATRSHIERSERKYRQPLQIDALPTISRYKQVLLEEFGLPANAPFVANLAAAVLARWTRNASYEAADWLRVTMGVVAGNRRRTLRLEAKWDGVHGLVAGGTGSGKSELLMTMIVGLALNYSPDIINFVLVDYKGGGAFKPFERLPHVVDIVTNLNKAGVDRMFTAINAEIKRRQQLNADTSTKDIIEYRRKGLHLPLGQRKPAAGAPAATGVPAGAAPDGAAPTAHPEGVAYPHLFIIIDEYSEMIDDNPEYKEQLESITRVGRSQGINLVLASQRPKGVTDQMRANIKFRMCLRVEQPDASAEMLRRPDAAFLPSGMPGRGYLQIGNEGIELIQVSYTGDAQPDDREAPVVWPGRAALGTTAPLAEEAPRLFDAAVLVSSELYGGKMARRPWPPFLSPRLTLQSAIVDTRERRQWVLNEAVTDWLNDEPGNHWQSDWRRPALQAAVGLVDSPAEARQFPLVFNLGRYHLLVFGDTGWGRTGLLRTLMTGLAATRSPDDLHIYVIDMGGRSFRALEGLPHVGAVLYADDDTFEERMDRLFALVQRMVDERFQAFSAAGAGSLAEYNTNNPERSLPAVLIAIDNLAPMLEAYEGFVEVVLTPLLRRSLAAGISFVVTAHVPNSVPLKLAGLFGERITFKQNNADFYMDVVGRGAHEMGDIAGRGYIRVDKRPLMFQAALPLGLAGEADERKGHAEADELERLAYNMQKRLAASPLPWRNRPDKISILPDIVPLARLLERVGERKPNRVEAVLGLGANLQPWVLDLSRTAPHMMIVGSPLSGKTTALLTFILSLAECYPPDCVAMVLIDLQHRMIEYGGMHRLDDLPHVLDTVMEIEECEPVVSRLLAEGPLLAAADPPRELFVFVDNFDDFGEESSRVSGLDDRMALLARRYGRKGLHFVAAGGPEFGGNELRRRIMAANLGVGLRNAAAVDALHVNRTPPALQGGNRELGRGRGFRVRSGQASLVQLATPYAGIERPEPHPDVDEDARLALALDAWVDRILERHGDARAEWSGVPEGSVGETGTEAAAATGARADGQGAPATQRPSTSTPPQPARPPVPDLPPPAPPTRTGRNEKLETLLPLATVWEVTATDGRAAVIGPLVAGGQASDPAVVLPHIRRLFGRIQRGYGWSEDTIGQVLSTMNDDTLIDALISLLSEDTDLDEEDEEPTGDTPEERAGFVFTTLSDKERQRLAELA